MSALMNIWLLCPPAAWDALFVDGEPVDTDGYGLWYIPYHDAVTDYMLPSGANKVYETIATQEQAAALFNAIGQENIAAAYVWQQADGLEARQVIPDDIMALMPDHIIYDGNGTPIGTETPTQQNPNWRHFRAGEKPRQFISYFSYQFAQEFY